MYKFLGRGGGEIADMSQIADFTIIIILLSHTHFLLLGGSDFQSRSRWI